MQSTGELSLAWNVITGYIRHKDQQGEKYTPSCEDLNGAMKVLHEHNLAPVLEEWYIVMFKEDLQNTIIPTFWAHFKDSEKSNFAKFPDAVKGLYQHLQLYTPAILQLETLEDHLQSFCSTLSPERLQETKPLKKKMCSLSRALLLAEWPVDFYSVLAEFFSKTFKAFQNKQNSMKDEETEAVIQCLGCELEMDMCLCDKYLAAFYETTSHLYELELLHDVAGDIPINVAHDYVQKHIQDTCKGNFEVSYLEPLKKWLDNTVLQWLSAAYHVEESGNTSKEFLSRFKDRLLNVLYESYSNVRLDQLFNIIIEFPESQAALEDLRQCLELTGLRPKLISSLRSSLETRLLHPGVNTSDILTAYISAIKALRVLDPTGIVLLIVCEPVCKYLRSREDTVRCIVTSLTDDSCGELASELMKGDPLMLEDSYLSDEENEDWTKWNPDPIDADPAKTTKNQRSSDIISMLVNIYGSKELFVNEYRTLLADRLLTTFSYNTEKEIRYLELLKLRFGESQLHYCEVMLKDVADSKRMNVHLNARDGKGSFEGDFPVNSMILSAQFWPAFREEKIKLPEYIWQHLKKYTAAFETLKGNRTLVWKPHLGLVNMEVTLKDRTLEFTVSPVHATILWHFQDKHKWTINELSSTMQMQASMLRRKITFWQSHGILQEKEKDVFVLLEEKRGQNQDVVVVEEEAESVTASSHDQREEELQTFWSFIVGMLTNMESLPLERIHSMLCMFAMQSPSANECGLQGVKQFLDKKVREHKLLYSGGLYRLPKFET